jgi:hypothetical protein
MPLNADLSSIENSLAAIAANLENLNLGLIQVSRGGTGIAAYAKGDILAASAALTLNTISVGTDGQLLQADSTTAAGVKWATVSASNHNILDGSVHGDSVAASVAKGALIVGNTTPKWDKLVVGTNGQVLTADSTQTVGIKWATLSSAPNILLDGATHSDTTNSAVVRGDLVIGNATPQWTRLALGTTGKFLRTNGTDPSWQLIQETDIVDGSIFPRLAGTETISGTYTFSDVIKTKDGTAGAPAIQRSAGGLGMALTATELVITDGSNALFGIPTGSYSPKFYNIAVGGSHTLQGYAQVQDSAGQQRYIPLYD